MSSKATRFASATSATNNIGKIIHNSNNVNAQAITEIPIARVVPDPKNNRKFTLDWENPSNIDPEAPNAGLLQAELESLQDMAETINLKGVGLLQPIVVIRRGDSYNLVSGHRRVLACKLAGRTTVPAIVRVDLLVRLSQYIENVQRKSIDLAEGLIGVQGILEEIGVAVVPGVSAGSLAKTLMADCKMSAGSAYRWANLLASHEPLVNAVMDGLVTTWGQIEELSKLPEDELVDQLALMSMYSGIGDESESGNAETTVKQPVMAVKKAGGARRTKDFVTLGKVRNTDVIKEVMARVMGEVPEGVNWSDLKQVEKAFKKMLDDVAEKLK